MEDLSQQLTNAKGLVGKPSALFNDFEYSRQHYQNKTKKEVIPKLWCKKSKDPGGFVSKLLYLALGQKQPPSVDVPCIAHSQTPW